jgi:6-pyruvoyltetrahydropterin/6-carboxytetrahydropterin synthase
METYQVHVTKDYLTFCSAHFIVFNGSQCERLHGHNYRIGAQIEAELDDDFLVFDFIALKNILRQIANELDHRLLVPLESNRFAIEIGESRVRISYDDREWIVPAGDCALLPIENTTAERLAYHVASRLLDEIERRGVRKLKTVRVEIEESPGQSAVYTRVLEPIEHA